MGFRSNIPKKHEFCYVLGIEYGGLIILSSNEHIDKNSTQGLGINLQNFFHPNRQATSHCSRSRSFRLSLPQSH